MYELPEIEIYRAFLKNQLSGKVITGADYGGRKGKTKAALEAESYIVGQTVWFVERRAHFLLLHLENGKRLCVELSESSSIYCADIEEKLPKTKPALVLHAEGKRLLFFGFASEQITVRTVREIEQQFQGIGDDPLDRHVSFKSFTAKYAKKRSSLKSALMDQSLFAGIGERYSDEIAFAARLDPAVKMQELSVDEKERLYQAMKTVLKDAVDNGGCELEPMYEEDQTSGKYISKLNVFDRAGLPCHHCGTEIEKKVIAKKKSNFCPVCQATD